MATTIETDLREILAKIDNRLERIGNDLIEFKAEISKDMTVLKVDMATVKADLTTVKEDVKDLRGSQRSQIWVLIVTVVGAIIKFGFFPNL
jgi:cob(I)alamin adenosyltransferase